MYSYTSYHRFLLVDKTKGDKSVDFSLNTQTMVQYEIRDRSRDRLDTLFRD